MSNRKWFQLSSSLIEVYTQSDISYKYKKLPLQYFYVTAARFSGPIAILYNKYLAEQVQVKLSETDQNSIMIFNPKGQLKKTIPFIIKDRVILFEFTQLQELIVLYASGEYVLVDPFSGKKFQGTFFIGQDEVNKTINERCVGAVMDGENLFVVREKQFGLVRNFKSYWNVIPSIKPNTQNPIFTVQNVAIQKRLLHNQQPCALIYLSKQGIIQEYNISTSTKRVLFDDQYVKVNYKNLLCLSKRENVLVLIFKDPFKIFYVTLTENGLKHIPTVSTHDPLIELKQRVQISKKKSRHNYISMNHQIIWLGDSQIAAYNNGKLLLIFDSQNMKAIYNHQTETKMIHSVVEEIDGFRVIGEDHSLYRMVNMIYQELVSLQSLQQVHNRLFVGNQGLEKEKLQLKEKLLVNKGEEIELSMKEKGLIIHQLHQLYQKYINKQMIPIAELNLLKVFAGQMLKEIIQNGVKCLDKLQLIKILKFATFVQNYFTFSSNVSKKDHRHSDSRMSQFKQVQDQNLLNNTSLSSFLSTPIHQLCSQLRILNTLKYASMKRFLTIEQFHFLKYQMKDRFLDLLLRYNMHYQLDLIFGDSDAKAKMFYHWAKCKIQRDNSNEKVIEENDQVRKESPLGLVNEKSDSVVFQTIVEKYQSLKGKFLPNNQLFSQLAKYCVDRNKLTLGLRLLQHQQDAQKKALVGLLILVAKKQKHLVQKVLQFTSHSKRSPILYRVIKQLLQLTFIQKHLWTNLFHNRLLIQQHFIKYNQFIYMYDNIKDYYLQNKMWVDLAFMGIRQVIENCAKEIISVEGIEEIGGLGTRCLFNDVECKEIKEKIVGQFQSLVPSMCLNLQKHALKPKSGLAILKRLKKQPNPIIQDDVDSVIPTLNDKQLQYLGQILLQQDNKQLATYIFSKIKSQKSYRILLKQGKYKEAIDLAYERKNLVMLKEMVEMIYGVTQQTDQEYLMAYAHERIKELERRVNK